MSVPSCCALLLVCLFPLFGAESPREEAFPGTIDGIMAMAAGGKAARAAPASFEAQGHIMDANDMVVSAEQYKMLHEESMSRSQDRTIATPWTGGVIPFTIVENDFTQQQIQWILDAMAHWEDLTCIKFRPATDYDTNKIRIHTGKGCWAHLGMMGGEQEVNLNEYCFWKGIIEHEFGHTIGMIHEHQRPNRDGYIRVNYYAVARASIGSLTKYAKGCDNKLGLPYDYHSVMHYGKTAFSEFMNETIFTRDPSMEDVIGMIQGPSFIDAWLVNKMYRCDAQCRPKPRCSKECFPTKNCQCFCPYDMPQETCVDNENDCYQKAQQGKCTGSPFTMHTFCRKSCGICKTDGSKPHVPCFNTDNRCQQWADSGECEKNSYWMKMNCAPACEVCQEGWGTAPTQGDCRNKHSKCQQWKDAGECARNPKKMFELCRYACEFCQEKMGDDPTNTRGGCVDYDTVCQYQAEFGQCKSLYSSLATECAQHCGTCNINVNLPADCVDQHVGCRNWAASGDCYSNSQWMGNNCKKSCSVCNGVQIPDFIMKQCKDEHRDCKKWADIGECHKNPHYMNRNCQASCRVCIPKDREPDVNGNCRDGDETCPAWAKYGECDRNPGYMLKNCKKSCNQC